MQSDIDNPRSEDNPISTDPGNMQVSDPIMPEDTLVGKEPVGPFPIIVLLVWMVALSTATIYALIACLFPQVDTVRNVWSVNLFGVKSAFPQNVQPLALSLLAGALGGQAYAMKSFCWYVGNRTLHWSWIPRYLLSPTLGAGMAFMFHFIVTSGLQGGQANANANPQVTVGIGILVGLFYEQAMEKLHQVATAFFADTPVGRDRIAHQPPGKIVPVIVKPAPDAPSSGAQATDPILDLSQHRPLKRPFRRPEKDVSDGRMERDIEPAQEQSSTITAVVRTSTDTLAIETTPVSGGMSDPDGK